MTKEYFFLTETFPFSPGLFFADAGLTQGFCNSSFGPNSRIFALTQEKFTVNQLKMVKIW